MKLSPLPFLLISLFLLAGCQAPTPQQNEPVIRGEVINSPIQSSVNLNAPAPIILTTQDNQKFTGVEGSYCYKGTCADKISPTDMIASAHLSYQSFTSGTITFPELPNSSDVSVFDTHSFAVPNVTCKVTVLESNPKISVIESCNVPNGNYILGISEQFSGGDLSWYFPVTIRK